MDCQTVKQRFFSASLYWPAVPAKGSRIEATKKKKKRERRKSGKGNPESSNRIKRTLLLQIVPYQQRVDLTHCKEVHYEMEGGVTFENAEGGAWTPVSRDQKIMHLLLFLTWNALVQMKI